MKVLIPIYPNNLTEDALLERQVNGSSLALCAAKELCSLCDAEIHVFTTENSICIDPSYPIHHHRQPLIDGKSLRLAHLPKGALQSVEHISRYMQDQDETLLIVDYRTTNLSADIITKAYHTYLESPGIPLLSIQAAKDNPAQFLRYYRIIAMDHLSVLDKENSIPTTDMEGIKFFSGQGLIYHTKKIPFNWAAHGFPVGIRRKEFFVRLTTDAGYRYVPVKKINHRKDTCHHSPQLYFKESHDTARVVMQLNSLSAANNSEIYAVSSVKQSGDMMCLITKNRDENSCGLFLQANCWKETDIEIRFRPLSMNLSPSGEDYKTSIHMTPDQQPARYFKWMNSIFYGPACTVRFKKEPDGFVVSVLSRHIDEKADFSEPPILSDFCDFIQGDFRRIKNKTGSEITGRQTCPEFYQANSAFVFSRINDLLDIEQRMSMGRTRGYIFPCWQVRSEYDALCAD